MNAAFFDTNILLYAADARATSKVDMARALLRTRRVVVSTQVLMEIYSAMRRKLSLSAAISRQWVDMLCEEIVVSTEAADVQAALQWAEQFQISHWDSLILRAAEKAQCDLVYTEDLNHGQMYGPVRVCNPFIEDFMAEQEG